MRSGPVTARRLALRLLEWVLSRMLTVKVRLYIGGVE